MKNPNRSFGLMLSAAAALVLSGCVVHHHRTDDWYDSQSYRQTSVGYYDGHVIPESRGGGWCYLHGAHHHEYRPDYGEYYRLSAGFYYYQGPVSFYFYNTHPIPAAYGGGYCRSHGRHVHRYHPGHHDGWRYHSRGRYYYYDTNDRTPRRYHPAEPAYADRYRRGQPTGTSSTYRSPHAGQPATGTPARSDDHGRARPTNQPHQGHTTRRGETEDGRHGKGHHKHEAEEPASWSRGWRPSTGSTDIGEAPYTGGRARTPEPEVTPADFQPRAPAYTPTERVPARPTHQPAREPERTGEPNIHRPYQAPAPTVRTPTQRSGRSQDEPSGSLNAPRVREPSMSRSSGNGVGASAPSSSRSSGVSYTPARAEKVKRAAKEEDEKKGAKKKGKSVRSAPAARGMTPQAR